MEDKKALRLADLALHKSDLDFAIACLDEIENCAPESRIVREALWRSAVVHFIKCFGDSISRSNLNAQKMFKDDKPGRLTSFQFFKNLRNKHFVHDENAYSFCVPSAVINKPGSEYKVAKILCLTTTADVQSPENRNILLILIKEALIWVESQADELCDKLTAELEAESHDQLLSREKASCRIPTIEDMQRQRQR